MDIDLLFKIAGIGILTAVLHTLLEKSGKEEFGFILTVFGVVIVFGLVIKYISQLFDSLKTLFRLY